MKRRKSTLTGVCLVILALLMASCGQRQEQMTRRVSDADKQLEALHQAHNYDSLKILVDSFTTSESLSEIKTNYWLGYVCSRKSQQRMAEIYWKKAIADESDDAVSLDFYAKSASRLANLLLLKGDYEGTLKVALAAKKRMEDTHIDTLSEYSNLLATIGSCQLKLNKSWQAAELFEKAYQNYVQFLKTDKTGYLYKSAVVGLINTTTIYLSEKRYREAYFWAERLDSLLTLAENQPSFNAEYMDKQRARVNFYRATALQGVGQQKEAAKAYKAALETKYAHTGDGHIEATDYLMAAQRWNEAATNFQDLNAQMRKYGMKPMLENIQQYYLPKFRANVGAHRTDSVVAVGMQICNDLDSAIIWSKRDEAAELSTIYDTQEKEAQIQKQRADLTRQRLVSTGIALVLVIVFFLIYTLHKRRAQQHLATAYEKLDFAHENLEKAHEELKKAYDQLEETTAAKERIESELRIARDIQDSIVPSVFPQYYGLDLYAYMMPAKYIGGDLYDFLIEDHHLYFCLGDVSGKGIPASLFMAQAARLFRALAKEKFKPADIATRLNAELTEGNERGMFVTMFLGYIDMATGKMEFCNAGHNPPALDNQFLEVESNAPIGLWPELEYVGETIDNIRGKQLFLYSDGLNEAENKEQEQFGDDHLLEVLAQNSNCSCQQVIETMTSEVEKHRNGADPNDDLTMMCLVVS